MTEEKVMNAPKEKKPRKKMGLTSQIFIGLIGGLIEIGRASCRECV